MSAEAQISAIVEETVAELGGCAEIYRMPSDIPVTPQDWLEHDIEMGDIAGRANARIREIAKQAGMNWCPHISVGSDDIIDVLNRSL